MTLKTASAALVLTLAAHFSSAQTPPPAPPAPAGFIQPESLEQGYIIVVEDKSKVASAAEPIYIASSHNGWDPGDPKQVLSPRSDMRWQIFMPKGKLGSRLAFKFTRGSWDFSERNPQFGEIENRLLPLLDPATIRPGQPPIIELAVETWQDKDPKSTIRSVPDRYREVTVSAGTIRKIEVSSGGNGEILATRDLLVWLPPGYDDAANASRAYPVLYMQDGQNLFDPAGGAPQEGQADETAAQLISAGEIEPLIIVGIPNAGKLRMAEYTPVAMVENVEPRGEAYVSFVINEVMPRVERSFRVRTGPQHTGIGGSSLGAVIAIEAATCRPDIFGKLLAESPSLTQNNDAALNRFTARKQWPSSVWLAVGKRELGNGADAQEKNDAYIAAANRLGQSVTNVRLDAGDSRRSYFADPDGQHNEASWARHFPLALKLLFPPMSR